MGVRILMIVPVALLISYVLWRFFGPVEGGNLVQWIIFSQGAPMLKLLAGVLVFAVLIAVCASVTLFAKKTFLGFVAVFLGALTIAYGIAAGWKTSGQPMHIVYFAMLTLSMTASWPMLFSDLVKGTTADSADVTERDR